MEMKHIATLAGALGAGALVGLTIGVAWRYNGLDTNCKPLPLMAEVPAGTERSALEIDGLSNSVLVRSHKAGQLLILLNDFELVPVDTIATPAEKAENIVAAFNLRPKSTTQGPLHVGFPATAYLASAAKEGFDVLINDRVTALLDKRPIQSPKVAPTVRTSDILIVKPFVSTSGAIVHDTVYSKAEFGTGTPDWYQAILILGDAGGSRTLPTPPGGFAKGAILSEAEKVATAVASGVAARARHNMRHRLVNGAQLSNRPHSSMGPMPRLRG